MSLHFFSLPAFLSIVFSYARLNASERKLSALGGKLFHEQGEVVEVVLNGASFKSGELKFLADFPHLTDLSLEKSCARDQDWPSLPNSPSSNGSTFTAPKSETKAPITCPGPNLLSCSRSGKPRLPIKELLISRRRANSPTWVCGPTRLPTVALPTSQS